MKVSLSTRIVLSFVFFVAIILAPVGFLSYWYGSQSLKEAAFLEMRGLAIEKNADLDNWLEERSADAALIAKQDELRVLQLYQSGRSANQRSIAENLLREFLPGPSNYYRELSVTDARTGQIVASTSPNEVGLNKGASIHFEQGKLGAFVEVVPDALDIGSHKIIASAPIRTLGGELLGVLSIKIDPGELSTIVNRRRGENQSLDAFLVNSERVLLTKPRFADEDTPLQLNTEAVSQLAAGNSGVSTALDYRGKSSLAAYEWNARRGIGLIVKIDQDEAQAPVRSFGQSVLLVSLVALLVALSAGLLLIRSITKPIRRLTKRVLKFAKEDTDGSKLLPDGDEVSVLEREFDRMAERIEVKSKELYDKNLTLHDEVETRRHQAEQDSIDEERFLRQRNALIALTEHVPSELASTVKFLTKLSAETLWIERVSVWAYNSVQDAIECIDLYCRETDEHRSGDRLGAVSYPHYFEALAESKVIAASQARTDGRTREFSESYLVPLGITSMLDVPIRVGGVLFGVLCHEHIGPERTWTADEQSFAMAVAEAFAFAVERSERLAAEATVRASEERLSAITGAAHDAILMMDAKGLIRHWNAAAERIFGYRADEAIGRELHKLIVPERYYSAHAKAFPTFLVSGSGAAIGKTLELEGVTKAGDEISVQLSLSGVQVDNEWHSIGILRDVTERNLAIAALKDAHAQLDHIFAHSPGIIYRLKVKDSVIEPISVSPNIEKLLGFRAEETLSLSWWMENVHPDDSERAAIELEETFERGELRTEYRIRHKDGTYRWVDDSRRVIRSAEGHESEMIGVLMDVTEKKAAEASLAESREVYDDLFENATDLIQAVRPDGSIAYVNRAWREALGYRADEIPKLSIFDTVPQEEHEHCMTEMQTAMSGTAVSGLETMFLSKDGRMLSVEGNITCKFVDGKPIHTRGIFHDTTERKAAENRLREINEGMLLQTAALESTANGVAITNTKGIIEWVNPAFSALTGYTAEDLIGQNPRVLKSGKNSQEFYNDLWGTIEKGEVWHGDLINRRKNGTLYYEEMTITPVKAASGVVEHYIAIKQDVTASRLAEEELRKTASTLAKAQQIARLGNWEWTRDTDETVWSDEVFHLLGLDPNNEKPSTALFLETVHPDDRHIIEKNTELALNTGFWPSIEYRVIRRDGSKGIIFSDGTVIMDENGEIEKFTGIMMDITERRESEGRFRSVVESANDGIVLMNSKGEIMSWNASAESIFGYEKPEVMGRPLSMLFPDSYEDRLKNQSECDPRVISETLYPGCRGSALVGKRKDGMEFPLEITISTWESSGGNLYSAILRDITQRKSLEDQLTYQTMHDPLTDLPNRVLFRDRLSLALKRSRRSKSTVGVLFIDLDNFKNVNDTLGHMAGDNLLIGVADRIKSCLRETDTAARFGGDEFAVLIEDPVGGGSSVMVAERIIEAVRDPFILNGTEAFVGTSIGIAETLAGNESREDMIRNADVAMYMAKTTGKNRFVIFKTQMHDAIVKRGQLEADLRVALAKNQFEVFYQPIVNLKTGLTESMESLVRWNHPRYGLVGPADFIKVAEETQLIVELGKWILREACLQTRKWQKTIYGGKDLSVTVNIASAQFKDDEFVNSVKEALQSSGLAAQSLVLELTETTMLRNSENTMKTLNELKEVGVRLAIDDFGTGYSSLSYLQKFDVDILKIDKSFIDNIHLLGENSAVAMAVISMSKSLHLRTIAEGIELSEQRDTLRSLGCKYGQGYLYAKPLPKSKMTQYLRVHTTLPPTAQDVTKTIAKKGPADPIRT